MPRNFNKIALIGSAFGYGAPNFLTYKAPEYLKKTYNISDRLKYLNIISYWYGITKTKRLN